MLLEENGQARFEPVVTMQRSSDQAFRALGTVQTVMNWQPKALR
jgi:hypothetical protein